MVVAELEETARQVAGRAGPAVVRVGRDGGRGCGVVLGEGTVLTNAHNLRGDTITVTFADGRRETGNVRGADLDGDLAVVSVDTGGAPALDWASRPAETGDVVFALARSASGRDRISFGMVSGTEQAFRGPRGRRITGSVEHTASLARGSSGGPLLDGEGRLVGLNTNRLGEGFYLALPADDDLRARVDSLSAGRSPSRPTLGVGLAPAGVARRLRRSVGLPERDGLLVRVVEEDSPGARAGLRAGDLLVEAGGRSLATVDDLFDVLDGVGETLALRVVRGVDELEVVVSFAEGAGSEEGSA